MSQPENKPADTPPPVEIKNPEPTAVKPATAPPPLFKSGLSSIDKLKQQIADRKKEQANQPAETQESNEPAPPIEADTPVTQEVFATVWDNYLMQLHQDKKMSLSVIFKNATWSLLSDSSIELVLASQHERELFEEERINIIPFMRKSLKHTGFEIQIRVNSAIRKTRVFTAEEKFTAMAEKNPLLNDLRSLLALDLEY